MPCISDALLRTLAACLIGMAVAACDNATSAAGSEPDTAEAGVDDQLFFSCGEARGSLIELRQITSGASPMTAQGLDYGATALTRLADKVGAKPEVREAIDGWRAAADAWRQGLRAIPPRIENGRFVEPDTTALTRALAARMEPIDQQLTRWVAEVCDD